MKTKAYTALKLNKKESTVAYCTVVRSFVTNYCECFSWSSQALGYIRARNFKSLLKLAESVNDSLIDSCTRESSCHIEYGTAQRFTVATQFVAFVTKYQFLPEEIPGLSPVAAAIEDFLDAERRNTRLNKVFAAHRVRGTERHWCIPLIRDVFCRVLGRTPHFEDILMNSDFSSGAAVGLTGDITHVAAKLHADKLLGSYEAFSYFEEAIWKNAQYQRSTLNRSDSAKCILAGPKPLGSNDERITLVEGLRQRFELAGYDEIKVVAKKAKSGRTIGKNPPVNNFVQKGVDKVMRKLLMRFLKLDLGDQYTNQILAYKGSDPDALDPYVTIDVRGASNSVITELIRSVCPPRWFHLLDRLRSHSYKLPDGQIFDYQMFVSMGNGFCFPLETLLFAAICCAAAKNSHTIPDYRVYGDDIIVRQNQALVVMECLRACGFRTNIDKTFVFGPFRESCGANWYDGRDVTPGYLKERLTSEMSLHVIHNALESYPETQAEIREIVRRTGRSLHFVPNIPMYDWVTDHAFRVPSDVALSEPGAVYNREAFYFAYPILISTPVSDRNWSEGLHLSDMGEEDMLLAAALRGSSHDQPFHLRRTVKTRSAMTDSTSVAEQRKLNKKLRAFEAFVGPHRTDFTRI